MASTSGATCHFCRNFFSDPRMLPCLHTFCYTCLCKALSKKPKYDFACPTCGSCFSLSSSDIITLPQDWRKIFQVNLAEFEAKISGQLRFHCDRCLDTPNNMVVTYCGICHEFLCHHCKKDHHRWKQTTEHNLIELSQENLNTAIQQAIPHIAYCKTHPQEVLKFYCETCKQLVCSDCIVLSHKQHNYGAVENICEKEKLEVQSALSKLEMSAVELESNISQSKAVLESIDNQKEEVTKIIEEEFKKVHQAIDVCKQKLLVRANDVCFQKRSSLNIQEMSATGSEIQTVAAKVHESLDFYEPVEFLSIKALILARLVAVRKKLTTIPLKPCKADHLTITFKSSTLLRDIENYCFIGAGAYPKCCTAFLGLCVAIVGVEKNIEIITRNVNGEPIKHGGEIITAELTKPGSKGNTAECAVQDNKNGIYCVLVTPQTIGEHYLDIKIGSEGIHSSPFLLNCRQRREYNSLKVLQTYDTAGTPFDVADSGKKLYVVHGNPSGISVIDKITNTVEILNTDSIQLRSGHGIAVWKGKLFVTDSETNCVYKLDTKEGKFITKFGSHGSGEGQLIFPCGLCVGTNGRIYVSESGNKRISVFQPDGTFVQHIPVGEDRIWGVTLDFHGNIYVVDHDSCGSVTVFSSQGERLQQYGKGQLHSPIGIAIDPEQQVVITEFGAHSSKIFSLEPDFHAINTFYHETNPRGVCLDKDGYIFVCDSSNGRICKY